MDNRLSFLCYIFVIIVILLFYLHTYLYMYVINLVALTEYVKKNNKMNNINNLQLYIFK